MPIGTMTSKGQITVPKEVRDELGLVAGTRVVFTRVDGTWQIATSGRRAVDLIGMVPWDGPAVTLEAMDEAIAAGAAASIRPEP